MTLSTKITNKISEISRPSPDYPRTYVPLQFDGGDWEQIEPLLINLVERQLNNVEDLEKWLEDSGELANVVAEENSRRYIAMTCNTESPEIKKAFLHFVEVIEPKLKPYRNKLDKKFLDCPYVDDLDADYYQLMIRSKRNSVELFREENIPLETELGKLSQRYQEILGAMTVEFRGKEHTMQQMGIYMQENDREVREESFRLTSERRLKDAEELEELFDKMIALRYQIAQNAGFDNFRDYQFRRFERFDYTPEDCFNFHKAIEELVVPICRTSLKNRKEALKVESVRPWDLGCDRYGRNPLRPFDNTDSLILKCQAIFKKVDSELGDWFQILIDNGLLDLDSRKGKAPGGYQATLREVRLPFIFMNAVGLNRDLLTLLHEGGHAFHTFADRDQKLSGYRGSPIEFAEVASMSMELLGAPYFNAFYSESDAARARYDLLEGITSILPWIATVDAFQHWIYTNPQHTAEERSNYWIGLMERFGAGVDFTGYEESLKYRWHAQLHIFEYPFYYVEYGIAQLGALQIWNEYRKDPKVAIENYKKGLSLGASRPLPELFTAAGINFDFSESLIKPLMDEVEGAMEIEAQKEI